MSNFNRERVLTVHHWTDRLFSFTTTRDTSFRFHNGHFSMIGLEVEGRPLVRAYSMVSANWEENLEFLSIKVPDGPLTSRLQHIKVGDYILVGRKPTGTLVTANLLPGKRLFLLSTGTGLAPFMSIIKDHEIYEQFEKVILVHGCRHVNELAYDHYINEELPNNEFFGDTVKGKLMYYPTVTREAFRHTGRIPDLIENGKMCQDLGIAPFSLETDRVMLCGSPQMLKDTCALLDRMGFHEYNSGQPGEYVIERAFVEK